MRERQINKLTKKSKSKYFNAIFFIGNEKKMNGNNLTKMENVFAFSLEYRLKNLQTKSQPMDNKNVVTISTGPSAMRLSNNGSNNVDEFSSNQRTSSSTAMPKVMTTSNGTSTINLTGPVTDL